MTDVYPYLPGGIIDPAVQAQLADTAAEAWDAMNARPSDESAFAYVRAAQALWDYQGGVYSELNAVIDAAIMRRNRCQETKNAE